ncbi:MAG TPA: hypothetical protein VN493_10495 [Thermoanaerobaculia bacterium]|nr:hypothetical protein [Thermoanaerobaculia bacterium]
MPRHTLILLLLAALPATAGPIPPDRIPGPLQPWTDWVLRGHEGALCSTFLGGEEKRCAWPGVLTLDLTDRGGSFRQEWTLEADAFVPLPGEARRWPLDLQLDGSPAAAVSRKDAPGLWLPAGTHGIAGSFRWDVLPESLPVPPEVGVVALTVRGAAVLLPERDETGRVFLQGVHAVRTEEDRLDIRVQRRIVDGVPLLLTTRIELAVSGKAREVLLGRALPDRFIPLSLAGPLPARLEPGGRLRVQVRPGNWVLELTARHAGPAVAIRKPVPGGPWAAEEIWVFEARPNLRLVDVEGVPAVDPQQTTLPAEWKALPAYRVRPGETLRLAERRRGAANPPEDRLTLHRVLWLDFDGGGYTWKDQMEGTLTRSWRLDVAPPTRLERVSLGGQDQVITRRPGSDRVGIEVRQGKVSLVAEGRLPGRTALPAVGWDHDFHQVNGEIRIPPGWRILGALGVDDAPGTWIDRWTLLDLFLVLLLALAVRHLWGNRWAALALAALVLTWHEPGAPRWIWVAVLAAEALRRVVAPEGRPGRLARAVSGIALGILALMTVAFLARQVRQAIYPALETTGSGGGSMMFSRAAKQAEEDLSALGYVVGEASKPQAEPAPEREELRRARLEEIDPRAVVATGSGLPEWEWHRVELRWSGPVEKDHRVRFLLVSPAAHFVLTLVRLALLVLLVLRALSAAGLKLDRRMPPAAAVLLCILFLPCGAIAQEEKPPSPEVLEQLRQQLLAPPDCHPECASSPRMFLEASPETLRLRFEVGAAAEVAVPLPGGAQQWLPTEVRIDGRPASVARTPDGRIWTRVEPGRHEILLSGPMPERETVQVPLPLRPHRVDVAANGWTVDGVHEDGQADDNLQLTRVRTTGSGPSDGSLQPGEMPPFLEVRRTLVLGLTWRVETRVTRISPAGVPATVAVPLLPGESVTTAGVRVQRGAVQVSLGPQASEAAWTSTLAPRPELRLAAPRTLAWTEIWRLEASPVWHVEAQGIPPILGPEEVDVRVPEWRPWPGESVVLAVTRPVGVAGQTLTVDRTFLTASPGRRATDATLQVFLRSSRGGRHTVVLPEGAELLSVQIDDQAQPVRQEGRDVVLPVRPGAQKIDLAWREPRGMSPLFRSPTVDLNVPRVNANVSVKVPASRWVLLAGGPRLGPAVLFWSVLVVIVLTALVLGRLKLTPLTTRDWVLLGIGLSQAPLIGAAVVAGWLLALGLRRRRGAEVPRALTFNLLQVLLVFWTVLAFAFLFWAIQQGLLGSPEMQIAGNGSWAEDLRWYADRAGEVLPAPWVFSVPLLVYRLAMLAWALWLALALLRWLRWAWDSFTTGGGWRRTRPAPVVVPKED